MPTINLSDQEFWAEPWPDRYAAFAQLRAHEPIAFYDEPEIPDILPAGPGYWAITRHADIVAISRQPELFCSGQGAVSVADVPAEVNEFFGSMISMDDPRHGRLRRIVSGTFTPRMLQQMLDHVERIAHEVLTEAIADAGPDEEIDFVTRVAAPFPLMVIGDLMGIPRTELGTVLRCANLILSGGDVEFMPEGSNPLELLLNAGAELSGLMHELAAKRRVEATDDLTSALVHARLDGEQLNDQEIASFFILLAVAGHETTRTAISHGVLALSEHPDQRAIWAADVDGVSRTATEEIVRWASPVIYMRRTTTQPVELSGHAFDAGEKVILFYPSANRDEAAFTDPDVFDVRRDPNPHVGFGANGPHFCLGAHLARREIGVMFRELFGRVPDLAVTGPPDRLHSAFINGIKHLPVRLGAARPA